MGTFGGGTEGTTWGELCLTVVADPPDGVDMRPGTVMLDDMVLRFPFFDTITVNLQLTR